MSRAAHGVAATLALAIALPALAATPTPASSKRRVFWGDLHLHTSYSTDAMVLGGGPATLDEAYRFARGETLQLHGQTLRAAQPLDFLAVTDHAEQLGVGRELLDPATALGRTDLGQRLQQRLAATADEIHALFTSKGPVAGVDTRAIVRGAWEREVEAAERWYEPGRFTTFVAYEWTSTPEHQNLHRNVIFRGTEVPAPFSSADSDRPEDLWTFLETARAKGVEALAIPHNSNVSNGLMFDGRDSDGRPLDAATARRRAENEPLVEIAQTKGQSETHPQLSPADEFADFELFEDLIGGPRGRVPGSYLRQAWGLGLLLSRRIGVNPYRTGVVGATDLHDGLPDTREETYRGPTSFGRVDDEQARQLLGLGSGPRAAISLLATGSGGLTGVWAEENTREAIYDALRRQETFATSGTRIVVRAFAGWDFDAALLGDPEWADRARARGIAMGGELPAQPSPVSAPRIVVWALRDPRGAQLERVQIVKVWLAEDRASERIFDVALSDGREADPATGRAPRPAQRPKGASELAAVWRDPDFDAAAPALYYARVLEVPTPRWSTLLAAERGLPAPDGVAAEIQERAWTSPIWYAGAPAR